MQKFFVRYEFGFRRQRYEKNVIYREGDTLTSMWFCIGEDIVSLVGRTFATGTGGTGRRISATDIVSIVSAFRE